MTSVNLAITLASASLRVVLVDADFHHPTVASVFHAPQRHDGLVRLLAGKCSPEEALVRVRSIPGLRLLLSDGEQVGHLHLLRTERFRTMLEQLYADADVIVVDSPPLPDVAEALAIADAVESVIVAVRLGQTRREKLVQLRELLARRGVSPLGFVVTLRDSPQTEPAYYYAADSPPALDGRRVPAAPVAEPLRPAQK